MKRTLAISLLLGLATAAVAQTPAAADKSAPHNAQVKAAQATSSPTKPAANVKVVAVPAKPAAMAQTPVRKPAAVAVQPVSKPASSPQAKVTTPAGKIPVVAVKPVPAPAHANVAVTPKAAQKSTPTVAVAQKTAPKPAPSVKAVPVPAVQARSAKDPFAKNKPAVAAKTGKSAAKPATVEKIQVGTPAKQDKPVAEKKPEMKTTAAGRRDPFISPVVRMSASGGSGCSSGKRCLAIDQIALKGVVKSDSGMIAVVVNAMDKAYFLRENDPVFNGYVTKITPDSIIFKETFHDKMGKELTRDVTKTISRPAA